jgi:hypothetical protein
MTTDSAPTDPTPGDPTMSGPTAMDPARSAPAPSRAGRFSTKFAAKTFDAQGQHIGPGPWLDLIGEANRLHPGFFGEPTSVGPWWTGGSVEQYAHARVIHHLDESVSIVALDETGDSVLARADTALRARTDPDSPAADPDMQAGIENGEPR